MFGHRSDGRKIKSLDPLFYAIPHLMPRRDDSMVFADMNIEMTELDRYVKEKRAECPEISHMSVIMAAMGRVMAEKPYLNRFVIGRRIFARKYISVCYNILTEFGPEIRARISSSSITRTATTSSPSQRRSPTP